MNQEPRNYQINANCWYFVYIELVNKPRASLSYSLNLSMRLLVHSLNYYVLMKGPNKNLKPQKNLFSYSLFHKKNLIGFNLALHFCQNMDVSTAPWIQPQGAIQEEGGQKKPKKTKPLPND